VAEISVKLQKIYSNLQYILNQQYFFMAGILARKVDQSTLSSKKNRIRRVQELERGT